MILPLLFLFVFPVDSVVPILKRNFDSYFVVSGNAISKTADANIPVAIGSLVKPFVALAYAKQNGPTFPKMSCDGSSCWRASGHGSVDLPHAMAFSCNTYFRNLAGKIDPNGFVQLFRSYGMDVGSDLTPDARIGIGADLKVAPAVLLKAYGTLLDATEDPATKEIVHGLELAATVGTAKIWQGRVIAKTGTAFCPNDEGDGWALVAYPAVNPKMMILVRQHRKTGAATAKKLAEVLGPLFGVR